MTLDIEQTDSTIFVIPIANFTHKMDFSVAIIDGIDANIFTVLIVNRIVSNMFTPTKRKTEKGQSQGTGVSTGDDMKHMKESTKECIQEA